MFYFILIIVAIVLIVMLILFLKSLLKVIGGLIVIFLKFCKRNWYLPIGILTTVILTIVIGKIGILIGVAITFILFLICLFSRKHNETMLRKYLLNNFAKIGKTTYEQVVTKLIGFKNKNYVTTFENIVKTFLADIEREHYDAINIELWEDVINYVSSKLVGETTTIELDKIIKDSNHDFSWTHVSTEHKLVKDMFERNVDDYLSNFSLDVIPKKLGDKTKKVDAITKNDAVTYLDEGDLL